MRTILLLALLFLPAALFASLKPAKLFTDNMVIQRERPIHIWGTGAAPGSTVSASFSGNSASTTATQNGEWLITLPAIPAPVTTPLTLTLSNEQDRITLNNILVGDVWICAGQSNMSLTVAHNANINPNQTWSVKQDAGYKLPDFNAKIDGLIRNFGIEKVIPDDYDTPQRDISDERDGDPYAEGTWKETTAESAAEYSATGFYFARNYRRGRLLAGENVPIGLIMTAWGGTPIESWMSMSLLESRPDFAERLGEIKPAEVPAKGRANLPSAGYNSRIHPLRNFGVRGVIWHQGESNSGVSTLYQAQLPAMVGEWRAQFENPALPFLIVQLFPLGRSATSGEAQNWPWMREAQELITESTPNLYVVPTLDLGVSSPIPGNKDMEIHSRDKQLLGQRAALVARQFIDGESIQSIGPKPVSVSSTASRLTITYDQDISTANQEAPRGFDIAGEDGVYVRPDSIVIEGRQVHLSAKNLSNPVSVRYGWSNAAHALSEKSEINADEYPAPANIRAASAVDGIHLAALPFRYEKKFVGTVLKGSPEDKDILKTWDAQAYEHTRGIIKTEHGLQRTRSVAMETVTFRTEKPITDFTLTLRAVKKASYSHLNPARRIFVATSDDGIHWTPPCVLSCTSEVVNKVTETITARPTLGILNSQPSFLKLIFASYLDATATSIQSIEIRTDGKEPANYPLFPQTETVKEKTSPGTPTAASSISSRFDRPSNTEPINLPATVNPLDYTAPSSPVTSAPAPLTKSASVPKGKFHESFDDFSKALAKSDSIQIKKAKPIDGDAYRAALSSGDSLTLNYQGKTLPGVLLYALNGQSRIALTIFNYGAKARERIQISVSKDGITWQPLALTSESSSTDGKGWSRTVYRSKPDALKGQSFLLFQAQAGNPLWALQLSSFDLE